MSESEIHAWIEGQVKRPSYEAMFGKPQQQEEIDEPDRYGGTACMDAIAACLTPEELRGFIKGTEMRYLWREQHKGGDRDLQKALWYLNWYLQHLERQA